MIIIQQAVHLVKLHVRLALDLVVYLLTVQVVMLLEVTLILVLASVLYALVFVRLAQVYYKLNVLHANMAHF